MHFVSFPVVSSSHPSRRRIVRAIRQLLIALLLALLPAHFSANGTSTNAKIVVLTLDGAIGPAAADYVARGLTNAERDRVALAVLLIDTPGGLDPSMRRIIKAILQSTVPVATYVSPSGARAASAGTYILYASHVAAMAPGTNLGAATPVRLGAPDEPKPATSKEDKKDEKDAKKGEEKAKYASDDATTQPMTQKQVNDAAAYIRSLAQLRGRNADWAERAVRKAVSLSAEEALKLRVIDHVAINVPDLLKQIQRKKVLVQGQEKILQTADAQIIDYLPDWRVRLLAVITDPSIALLLMTIGIYGLIFEFSNPGIGVAGVLGAICLLLALYALQLLPVNYAGLALILLGLGLMVAEAFMPTFGVIGIGGIAAFVIGAVILIDTELPGFGIPLGLIVSLATGSALLIVTILGMALKARRRTVVSGEGRFIGGITEIVDDAQGQYWVRLQGETWRVNSKTPLRRGQTVRVVGRQGLVLDVAPADSKGE